MTDVSAKMVMDLRAQTGVSMMACKKALLESQGNVEQAIDILRKRGEAKVADKADRQTNEGTIAISGRAVVSLLCETDFVAKNADFIHFAESIAEAVHAGGKSAGEAFFAEQRAALMAKLGENITLGDVAMLEGGELVGTYVHSTRKLAALVAIQGKDVSAARDIAMHTVAIYPKVLSPQDLDPAVVSKEKEIWKAQLTQEGKPEAIQEKILLGKEKKFREEHALLTQPFVKNTDQSVGDFAASAGITLTGFLRAAI